jgi:hypothetical protein
VLNQQPVQYTALLRTAFSSRHAKSVSSVITDMITDVITDVTTDVTADRVTTASVYALAGRWLRNLLL